MVELSNRQAIFVLIDDGTKLQAAVDVGIHMVDDDVITIHFEDYLASRQLSASRGEAEQGQDGCNQETLYSIPPFRGLWFMPCFKVIIPFPARSTDERRPVRSGGVIQGLPIAAIVDFLSNSRNYITIVKERGNDAHEKTAML